MKVLTHFSTGSPNLYHATDYGVCPRNEKPTTPITVREKSGISSLVQLPMCASLRHEKLSRSQLSTIHDHYAFPIISTMRLTTVHVLGVI
jgi:hypothetical protein